METKNLIVLLGPTGVGKTESSINIAKHFNTDIVSSDSRQVYKELSIGVAVPSKEQLSEVNHHFIHTRSIFQDYTAGMYEREALPCINQLFQSKDNVLLVGGSGLYIDAVCQGLNIPATENSVREYVSVLMETQGIEGARFELKKLDPEIWDIIDVKNPQRVMRALEVCLTTGEPYSKLLKADKASRKFNVIKIGFTLDREELYSRINQRVDIMLEEGLEEEARALLQHKEINALKTVGYREFFDHFDGKIDKDEAIRLIKRNSRHYAKRQISWFGRYNDISWFNPKQISEIIKYAESKVLY